MKIKFFLVSLLVFVLAISAQAAPKNGGGGASDVNVVNTPLEVINMNCTFGEAPTITLGGVSPTSPVVGGGVSLQLNAADPEGGYITIKSEFVEMPAFSEAVLTPAVGSTPAFYPDIEGMYVIQSKVIDEDGCSAVLQTMIETNNPTTVCQTGEYLSSGSCIPWTDCVPGQYVVQEGTQTTDRICADCAPGTTSYTTNASVCVEEVTNHPPVITSVDILPETPTTDDNLTCIATGEDQDGDTITFHYSWLRNGSTILIDTNTLNSNFTSSGDLIACSVFADDGTVITSEEKASVFIQ